MSNCKQCGIKTYSNMEFCCGICLREFNKVNEKSGEHYAWCVLCQDYVAYGVSKSDAEQAATDHKKTHTLHKYNNIYVSKIPSDEEIIKFKDHIRL